MNEKRKKMIILTMCAITLMLASILGTYAYFVSSINNENRQEAEVDTGTMRLRFADNDEGINAKLMLGESITKKFTLENTGTLDATVSIEWLDMINTYTEGSLTYTLEYSETEEGDYIELVSSTNVPTSSTEFTSTLVPDITIPVGKTYYYNLVITLNNLNDVDQTEDLNASFSTKFIVSQPSTNRKYTLTIDPNGGTINGSSEIQTINLKVGETYSIINPNNTGCNQFGEWKIIGIDSILENSTITMGKSNIKLVAQYNGFKLQEALESINAGKTPQSVNTTAPNFANPARTCEGVFAMEDDYGTSYYYRGNVDNNYVKFGDFYWRIIRINGDGSLRIIYDGVQGYANGVSNTERLAYTGKAFNALSNDNKYVGWMFGGAQGTASISMSQAQTNTTNSDLKTLVDSWYKLNIEDKNLGDKVADVVFCNDRSTPGKTLSGWSSDTALGHGRNSTAYGATARTNVWNSDLNKVKPRFTCPQKNDAFTVSDETKGNGDLTYPIGLITADEIVAAGSGKYGTSNLNYYLYKGAWYWSLSSVNFYNNVSFMFRESSGLYKNTVSTNTGGGVAPVINLKAEYVQTMIGDGTISNPYKDASYTL